MATTFQSQAWSRAIAPARARLGLLASVAHPARHYPGMMTLTVSAPRAAYPAEGEPDAGDTERRATLGRFLRARRERLAAPEPSRSGRRRRTPGLRREEVAEAAGVSAAWYTWLEQGRDVRPSAATVARLGEALRLSPDDRVYLHALALSDPHHEPEGPTAVPTGVQQVLDALAPFPAYVADARWNVVAWNRPACAVVVDFAALPARERNAVRLMFLHPRLRAVLPEWEVEARNAVAVLRGSTAAYVGEPWHRALVAELTAASPEFARWWPELDLTVAHSARKVLAPPDVGRLVIAPTTLHVAGEPDLRMLVYTPADGPEAGDTHARLVALHDRLTQSR